MFSHNNCRDAGIHSIKMFLGLTKRETCPKCGSEKWYKARTYTESNAIYTDGYHRTLGIDYDYSTHECDDCGHSSE